jgi:hypothetical protein
MIQPSCAGSDGSDETESQNPIPEPTLPAKYRKGSPLHWDYGTEPTGPPSPRDDL